MELQDLEKGKEAWSEMHSEVWCTKCKVEGHYKDQCPVYRNYVAAEGPNALKSEHSAGPSTGLSAWCSICQVVGHHPTNHCYLLHKYVQSSRKLFCNFCWSVEHDEKDYHNYDLMMDRTLTYRMHDECHMQEDHGSHMAHRGFQGRGGGAGWGRV